MNERYLDAKLVNVGCVEWMYSTGEVGGSITHLPNRCVVATLDKRTDGQIGGWGKAEIQILRSSGQVMAFDFKP